MNYRQRRSAEQKLIDIIFEIGLTIKSYPEFHRMSNEELAEWIRKQLSSCGYETTPMGASWGVLMNGEVEPDEPD